MGSTVESGEAVLVKMVGNEITAVISSDDADKLTTFVEDQIDSFYLDYEEVVRGYQWTLKSPKQGWPVVKYEITRCVDVDNL